MEWSIYYIVNGLTSANKVVQPTSYKVGRNDNTWLLKPEHLFSLSNLLCAAIRSVGRQLVEKMGSLQRTNLGLLRAHYFFASFGKFDQVRRLTRSKENGVSPNFVALPFT